MRYRPMIAATAAGMLLAALPAHAATSTLDGKKTKTLHFADKVASPQDNDKDIASLSASDRTFCSPPRCAKFPFVYKPAKGVKSGPFSVRITWTYPGEDYDLYVAQDNGGAVAQCGASAGLSELVIVAKPIAGHKYTVVIDHYRALPDTVNATVQFPTTEKMPTTAPSVIETNKTLAIPVNCGLSTS